MEMENVKEINENNNDTDMATNNFKKQESLEDFQNELSTKQFKLHEQ